MQDVCARYEIGQIFNQERTFWVLYILAYPQVTVAYERSNPSYERVGKPRTKEG